MRVFSVSLAHSTLTMRTATLVPRVTLIGGLSLWFLFVRPNRSELVCEDRFSADETFSAFSFLLFSYSVALCFTAPGANSTVRPSVRRVCGLRLIIFNFSSRFVLH